MILTYHDRLIYRFANAVNSKIAPLVVRPDAAAAAPSFGAGGTLRRRAPGDSWDGAVPHIEPPGAAQARGSRPRQARREEHLLRPPADSGRTGRAVPRNRARQRPGNTRSRPRPRRAETGPEKAPGHRARTLRPAGGQVRAQLLPGADVARLVAHASRPAAAADGRRPRRGGRDAGAIDGQERKERHRRG